MWTPLSDFVFLLIKIQQKNAQNTRILILCLHWNTAYEQGETTEKGKKVKQPYFTSTTRDRNNWYIWGRQYTHFTSLSPLMLRFKSI